MQVAALVAATCMNIIIRLLQDSFAKGKATWMTVSRHFVYGNLSISWRLPLSIAFTRNANVVKQTASLCQDLHPFNLCWT